MEILIEGRGEIRFQDNIAIDIAGVAVGVDGNRNSYAKGDIIAVKVGYRVEEVGVGNCGITSAYKADPATGSRSTGGCVCGYDAGVQGDVGVIGGYAAAGIGRVVMHHAVNECRRSATHQDTASFPHSLAVVDDAALEGGAGLVTEHPSAGRL